MKKPYACGMVLLIVACVLMHAFAKPADDIRLLYHVLESFGYYTGYLHTRLTITLWILLSVSILVLIYFAFKLMWRDKAIVTSKILTSKLRAIPLCVLLLTFLSCLIFVPAVHIFALRSSNGVDSVIYRERTSVFLIHGDVSPNGSPLSTGKLLLCLDFYKFNPVEEAFRVKIIDINDESKEYELPYEITGRWLQSFGTTTVTLADIIPGFIEEKSNYKNLRFKIVIYDENKSKTFNLYFDAYKNF